MHTINDIPKQHWKDGVLVDYTEEERQALLQAWNEDAERINAYNALKYQRERQAEYPSFADQLDALWKGGAEAEAMLAKVQAVKNKYPKGAA